MKRFFVLGVVTMVAGIGMFALEASAGPKGKGTPPFKNTIKPIINTGNTTAVGGNGGNNNGNGIGNQGNGNGGGAVAVGGKNNGTSAGNVTAVGGNGGKNNGNGIGNTGNGNGGGAVAVGGNNSGTIINGNNNTVTNVTNITNKNITFSPVFGGGRFGGGSGSGGGVIVADNGGGFSGAPGIAIASTPDQTVIAGNGNAVIAVDTPSDNDINADQAEREETFTRRFLKVKNDADVAMKVYVQYRGFDDKKWAWLPADPGASQNALVYDLRPGQEVLVEHNSRKVSASRVRVWAVAQGQSWLDYRDQDLWIVPEIDQRGDHHYLASEMKTFTFIFPKLQPR